MTDFDALTRGLDKGWARGREAYEAAGKPENGWEWEQIATRVQDEWIQKGWEMAHDA